MRQYGSIDQNKTFQIIPDIGKSENSNLRTDLTNLPWVPRRGSQTKYKCVKIQTKYKKKWGQITN